MKTEGERVSSKHRSTAVACATAACLLVLFVGAGRAAIPGASGQIDGCIAPRTGALRVVDTEAGQQCGSKERTISWPSVAGGGGPKAYGFVQWFSDGVNPPEVDVDETRSVGLSDSMVTTSDQTFGDHLCFDVPFDVDNISVTGTQPLSVLSAVLSDCGNGTADFMVRSWDSASQNPVPTNFFIVLR